MKQTNKKTEISTFNKLIFQWIRWIINIWKCQWKSTYFPTGALCCHKYINNSLQPIEFFLWYVCHHPLFSKNISGYKGELLKLSSWAFLIRLAGGKHSCLPPRKEWSSGPEGASSWFPTTPPSLQFLLEPGGIGFLLPPNLFYHLSRPGF